eukprot:5271844-Pleurochrysis_carterae.AAC.1
MSIASPPSAPVVDDAAASAVPAVNVRLPPRVKLLLRYPLAPYPSSEEQQAAARVADESLVELA